MPSRHTKKLARNVSKTEVKGVEEDNDRLVSPRPRLRSLSRVSAPPWRAPGIRTVLRGKAAGTVPGHPDSGVDVSSKAYAFRNSGGGKP
ncbi:hypothetical protein CSHISOI_10083 [Colletotrichum shisoi]|uniref:Uncharacterized protein n=1 Tax=Colletotrichum shisoi TaxID=2078593 RepID=A0A5Q4BEL2_9PEZI|nr:hypothetical protein CSHISOI_10083 [Colletotrichum shisoi]